MSGSVQSVEQTVTAMATVLADYLTHQEIAQLTASWRQHSTVSVKMIQECVLDATTQYPRLRQHRSAIRQAFWSNALHMTASTANEDASSNSEGGLRSESALVSAFYAVMRGLSTQLPPANRQQVFAMLHQMVAKERTFKGQNIDMMAFLNGQRPWVPDDIEMLNNLVQLAYVCVCDIEGPVEADHIFYHVSEAAKAEHATAVVQQLF